MCHSWTLIDVGYIELNYNYSFGLYISLFNNLIKNIRYVMTQMVSIKLVDIDAASLVECLTGLQPYIAG